jgi:ferrochelatase
MRNWTPFIKQAIDELAAKGVTRMIGIPLAPQFSTLSVSKYFEAASAVLPAGISIDPIHSFFDHPLLLDAFAERLRAAAPRSDEEVVFTAQPAVRVIESGDPYANEVAGTARGVAERCGLTKYLLAYQSAGRELLSLDRSGPQRSHPHRDEQRTTFLVAPVGLCATTRDPLRHRR